MSAWIKTKDMTFGIGWYWYRNEEIDKTIVRVNRRFPSKELLAFLRNDSRGRAVDTFGDESEWQPVSDPLP